MTTPLLQEDKAAGDAERGAGRDAGHIAELQRAVEEAGNSPCVALSEACCFFVAGLAVVGLGHLILAPIAGWYLGLESWSRCIRPAHDMSKPEYYCIWVEWCLFMALLMAYPLFYFIRDNARYLHARYRLWRAKREG